jgi:hypothetical protein
MSSVIILPFHISQGLPVDRLSVSISINILYELMSPMHAHPVHIDWPTLIIFGEVWLGHCFVKGVGNEASHCVIFSFLYFRLRVFSPLLPNTHKSMLVPPRGQIKGKGALCLII